MLRSHRRRFLSQDPDRAKCPEKDRISNYIFIGSKSTVRGQNNIRNKVGMSMKSLLGDSILTIFSGQLPDNQGLVPGAGEDHVRVLGVGGDLGHPSKISQYNLFF